MIKFNKHHVTNGTTKARCHYSVDNRVDGRKCVSITAKDYGHHLAEVLGSDNYSNNTDFQTDYFDKGRVVLFEDHPLYPAARERAEQEEAIRAARWAKADAERLARWNARMSAC